MRKADTPSWCGKESPLYPNEALQMGAEQVSNRNVKNCNNFMSNRDPKTLDWRIALAVVVLAFLACGFVIYLAKQKVEVEEKVERKFSTDKNRPRPTPKFKPLEPQPDN